MMPKNYLEDLVYNRLCVGCKFAKKCHDDCETCDRYNDELACAEEEEKACYDDVEDELESYDSTNSDDFSDDSYSEEMED